MQCVKLSKKNIINKNKLKTTEKGEADNTVFFYTHDDFGFWDPLLGYFSRNHCWDLLGLSWSCELV